MESLAIIGDLGLNVLDEKEIARCKQLFEFYDEDKDGKLTYDEGKDTILLVPQPEEEEEVEEEDDGS